MSRCTGSPAIIVLAAGRGERFIASGGTTHKLQALLAGRRVIDHTLDAVQASGLPWHLVGEKTPGMGDSIAAGVRALADAAGWLILPADLPLVRPATLLQVAHALHAHEVVQPAHRGQGGHPVGFRSSCRDELLALQGDQGARAVAAARRVFKLEVDDIGCITDVDTVELLNEAELLHSARLASAA